MCIWKQHGVRPEAYERLDAELPGVRDVIERLGPDLARVVFNEAVFQVVELKKRSPEFQAAYLRGS